MVSVGADTRAARPGAIVVGAHANGLGVIRSLGPRQIPIALVTTRGFDVAQRSRWVSELHHLPDLHERPAVLAEFLERQAQRWAGWLVVPTNDDALTALSQHHARLSGAFRLLAAPWPVASQFVDKGLLHQAALSAGLDVPHCYGPATRATAASPSLRFPVVVKPIQHDRLISLFGVKLYFARDERELIDAVACLEHAALDGVIFDFVPGPDSNILVYCLYVSTTGAPSRGVTIRKLRQYPATIGAASAAEVVPDVPGLRETTLALVEHVGYRGLVFAEFKRHAQTGRLQFIEVNGRPVLFNSLPRLAGLDLVGMAWDDVVLGKVDDASRPLKGATWVHVQADLLTVRGPRATRPGVREWLAPYLGPARDAVWSWTDPAPFLAQSMRSVRRMLGR